MSVGSGGGEELSPVFSCGVSRVKWEKMRQRKERGNVQLEVGWEYSHGACVFCSMTRTEASQVESSRVD